MSLDKLLVKFSNEDNSPILFILLVLFVFIFLTIIWSNLFEGFTRLKSPQFFTTTEQNIANISRELRNITPDITIVGSSLGKRIQNDYFDKLNVLNLSLDGGSQITGLEILKNSKILPKIILIEINILDRTIDQEIITKAISLSNTKSFISVLNGSTKPLHYLFSKPFFAYSSTIQNVNLVKKRNAHLVNSGPIEYDNNKIIDDGISLLDQRSDWDLAYKNHAKILELTRYFEEQGSKVFFLYLPFSDKFDKHLYSRRNRIIISGNNNFICSRCIDARKIININELRWGDGVHLDDRSALLIAESLQSLFLNH